MEKVIISKPSEEELKKLKIEDWAPWSCEPTVFDWYYDVKETCYFKKGHVKVWIDDNNYYEIKSGDLVTFPKGLKCKWEVIEKVEKVYKFGD